MFLFCYNSSITVYFQHFIVSHAICDVKALNYYGVTNCIWPLSLSHLMSVRPTAFMFVFSCHTAYVLYYCNTVG